VKNINLSDTEDEIFILIKNERQLYNIYKEKISRVNYETFKEYLISDLEYDRHCEWPFDSKGIRSHSIDTPIRINYFRIYLNLCADWEIVPDTKSRTYRASKNYKDVKTYVESIQYERKHGISDNKEKPLTDIVGVTRTGPTNRRSIKGKYYEITDSKLSDVPGSSTVRLFITDELGNPLEPKYGNLDYWKVHYLEPNFSEKAKTLLNSTEIKKEKPMQTTVETKHFVNNIDVTNMSEQDLIDAIKMAEKEVKSLQEVKVESKKVKAKVEEINAAIAKMVEHLDNK